MIVVYTAQATTDMPTDGPDNFNTAEIVGITIGAIVALIIVIVCCCLWVCFCVWWREEGVDIAVECCCKCNW